MKKLIVLFGMLAGGLQAEEKSLYLTDLLTIKAQMENFYIDSSRFTTVENLDDSVSGTPSRPWQAINAGGGAIVVNPIEGFPRREFQSLWNGPYLSWSGSRDYETSTDDYDEGAPLDLNGTSSIYFYTPLGLVEPRSADLSLRYYGDSLGTYALVTHGANGQYDGNLAGAGAGDDVGVAIPGFTVTIPAVSSARRSSASTKGVAGWTLVVRGVNLGSNTGSAAVLVSGSPTGTVTEWTTTRITVALPTEPALGSSVQVRLASGGLAARTLSLIDAAPATSVPDWFAY